MQTIPNEFTPCEVYREWTIAIYCGSYAIFNQRNSLRGGRYGTREAARRSIDQQWADEEAIAAGRVNH